MLKQGPLVRRERVMRGGSLEGSEDDDLQDRAGFWRKAGKCIIIETFYIATTTHYTMNWNFFNFHRNVSPWLPKLNVL